MFLKILMVFCVFLIDVVFSKIRVPPNPCPNVFNYYKNPKSEEIYGQAIVPYDGKNKLEFGVNASMVGYFNKADLRVHLTTPPSFVQQYSELRYNIFFPIPNVVPKITQIKYNNRVYCAGPPEPLIAGGAGITNVWAGHVYSYSTFSSNRDQSEEIPTNINPVVPNQIESNQDSSDVELEVRDPNDVNLSNNFQETNPFLANNQKNTNKPSSTTESAKKEVTIQSNIKENGENLSNNKNVQCGVSKNMIVSLILGGEEISEGLFPWLVAMFVSKGNSYEYKCTANLISEKHVITAARCIQFFKVQVVSTEDMLFVFGKSDISRWATNGAVTRGAKKVQTHPEYDQNSAHGDVSVITLDKRVAFTNYIAPICLWEGSTDLEQVIDTKGTTAGWGMDENTKKGKYSIPKARYVDMPIVSQENCLYSNFTYGTLTSDMTFCAGDRDGKGPCIGDSGAAFMMKRNGKYYLRGLVSIALSNDQGKCDLNNFVIFCDAAKCRDWIQKAMEN